eukprot:symbB.v1.2.003814.t3/scaffold192.1/size616647/25
MVTKFWAMDVVKKENNWEVSFLLHTAATSFRLPNFMLLGRVWIQNLIPEGYGDMVACPEASGFQRLDSVRKWAPGSPKRRIWPAFAAKFKARFPHSDPPGSS